MDKKIIEELKAKYRLFHYKNLSNRTVFYQEDINYPRIDLPTELKRAFNPAPLPWAENVLTYYMSRLSFDGFSGDQHGYTKLFYKTGASEIVQEAIKDSLVDGVSFIFISKDEDNKYKSEIFYRKACEISVYSENNEIVYAYLPGENEYDIVIDFNVGMVHVLKNDLIFYSYEYSIEIVPIYPMGVLGDEKIGRKLMSDKFFSLQRQASVLNFLTMQGSLLSLNNRNLLIAQGIDSSIIDDSDEEKDAVFDSKLENSKTPVIFSPQTGGTITLEQLSGVELSDVFLMLDRLATQAALSVGVPVKTLIGEEKTSEVSDLFSYIEESLGSSLEKIAKILMKNYLGENVEVDYSLVPVFAKFSSVQEMGQIGDALFKVSQILSPEELNSLSKRLLGFSVKEEKMLIELPSVAPAVSQEESVYNESTLSDKDFLGEVKSIIEGDN